MFANVNVRLGQYTLIEMILCIQSSIANYIEISSHWLIRYLEDLTELHRFAYINPFER
jgi:hypothetical protein